MPMTHEKLFKDAARYRDQKRSRGDYQLEKCRAEQLMLIQPTGISQELLRSLTNPVLGVGTRIMIRVFATTGEVHPPVLYESVFSEL